MDASFIADISAADAYGRSVASQAIFDEALTLIRDAKRFVVLDYFLFNSNGAGSAVPPARSLTKELRDALIERKRLSPDLRILFITDPINDVYGGALSPDLAALRNAGVDVLMHSGGGSFKNQLKRADSSGARYALIFGADELAQGVVTVKSLRDGAGAQVQQPLADAAAWAASLKA